MKGSLFLIPTIFLACNSAEKYFDATGVFEAQEIIVSAEATGKISNFMIEEGTELKASQAIGQIDCQNIMLQKAQVEATMEALALKQNSAAPQVQVLQEQLATQQNQIGTQREQLRIVQREQNRLEKLLNAHVVPSKQYDDVSGQVSILQKQIQTSESQLAVLRQQIKSHESQVSIQNRGILSEKKPLQQRIAQINEQLSHCQIRNPTAGTVLVKYTENSEIAIAGKPLYKLADLSIMTLRAYITGEQLGQIKVNQPIKIFVDKGKDDYKELAGTVTWISSKAEFTPKTIQTKDERANLVYAIKVAVKNDGFLKMGMYGELKF